jgi:hypothetical protein
MLTMADEPSIDDLQEITTPDRPLRSEEAPQEAQWPSDLETRFPGKVTFRPVNESGDPDTHTITLPLPAGLTFQDTVAYENAELSAIGGIAADGGIEALMSAMGTYAGPNFQEQALKAVKDLGARAGGNRARAALGRTPNPNTRALFKQPNLRTFVFSYKMVPQSSDEADQIIKLIKLFRAELYPTSTSTDPDDFQSGFFFPKRFQIKFYLLKGGTGGTLVETDDVPKIQPAYLSAFSASYNSGGPAMFIDAGGDNKARFSEVDISMTFMESRTLFKPDVKQRDF